MKGEGKEILYWITYHHEYAPLMSMSRQRLVGLRTRINKNEINEGRCEELLSRLQNRMESLRLTQGSTIIGEHHMIRKVRDAYDLPAIVCDHHGRKYSELTLIKMVVNDERMKDLNIKHVYAKVRIGMFPSEEVVREVLRRKGWYTFEKRIHIPSVWEVSADIL